MMAGFARSAAAVAVLMGSALPCYGRQCNMLDARIVQYSAASCTGASASSCWTIVSVDLPDKLPHAHLKAKASSLDSWLSNTDTPTTGLTVVHTQGDHEEQQHGEYGLHYSIDTRIVELADGPSVLQVQVLFGDGENHMSKPTPGWHHGDNTPIHAGGRRIELDIIHCEDDYAFAQSLSPGTALRHPGPLPLSSPTGIAGRYPLWESDDESSMDLPRPPASSKLRASSINMDNRVSRVKRVASSGPMDFPPEDFESDDYYFDWSTRSDAEEPSHQPPVAMTAARKMRYTRGFTKKASDGHSVDGHETDGHKTNDDEHDKAKVHEMFDNEHDQAKGHGRSLQLSSSSCDPNNGGDEWCAKAISTADAGALKIQGMSMYCSRECGARGALWCHIFGKRNCRLCSSDCITYCNGRSDCMCHPCPESGATETWPCSAGDNKACYDQISEGDYLALSIENQMLSCDATCLNGGELWCNAMGIEGCRFCSKDCDKHCSSSTSGTWNAPNEGGVEDEQCDCVQCPDGLTAPSARSGEISVDSCAAKEDADAYCYSQIGSDGKDDLASRGMALECHPSCLPGVVWPVWCYAQETLGCRYCSESCDDLCGEGVSECEHCYQCGGRDETL